MEFVNRLKNGYDRFAVVSCDWLADVGEKETYYFERPFVLTYQFIRNGYRKLTS